MFKEHEGTISLLQQFRNSATSNAESQKVDKNDEKKIGEKMIKEEPSSSQKENKNISSPKDDKKSLKRPHVKLELEKSPKTEDDITNKKVFQYTICIWVARYTSAFFEVIPAAIFAASRTLEK